MSSPELDVCVIGTGAGGGVMIDQLTAAGFSGYTPEQVTGAAKVTTIWGGEQ